jgi:hypothetical protein
MIFSVGIIFGNNYPNTSYQLDGCVNDALAMERLLKEELLFNDVHVYTEATGSTLYRIVLEAVRRTNVQNVDNLWIHFSGHATQVPSKDNYESDGLDECIVPSDYRRVGVLRDNFFLSAFKRVNPRTNVFCTFDCCHSGTIADIKYAYVKSNFDDPVITHSGIPCEARVLCISGCRDAEKAQEVLGSGIMTKCLVQILREKGAFVPLRTLIDSLRVAVQRENPAQYPVLSSSKRLGPEDTLLQIKSF